MTIDAILDYAPHNSEILSELQQRIMELHEDGFMSIVPFVGSGLSAFAFPTWKDMLLTLAQKIMVNEASIISDLLNSDEDDKFERAADILAEKNTDLFYSSIRELLGDEQLKKHMLEVPYTTGNLLPFIFRNCLLITTNFDHVLELIYRNFEISVSKPTDYQGVLELVESPNVCGYKTHLFKVHGDIYDNEEDIIFTGASYKRHYEEKPELVETLQAIYKNRSMLFLGSSLTKDRTVDILKKLGDEKSKHYAIISCDEETLEARYKELVDEGIYPIIYPQGKHESLKIILKELLEKKTFAANQKVFTTESGRQFSYLNQPFESYRERELLVLRYITDMLNRDKNEKLIETVKKYPDIQIAMQFNSYFIFLIQSGNWEGCIDYADRIKAVLNKLPPKVIDYFIVQSLGTFSAIAQTVGNLEISREILKYCSEIYDKEALKDVEHASILSSLLSSCISSDYDENNELIRKLADLLDQFPNEEGIAYSYITTISANAMLQTDEKHIPELMGMVESFRQRYGNDMFSYLCMQVYLRTMHAFWNNREIMHLMTGKLEEIYNEYGSDDYTFGEEIALVFSMGLFNDWVCHFAYDIDLPMVNKLKEVYQSFPDDTEIAIQYCNALVNICNILEVPYDSYFSELRDIFMNNPEMQIALRYAYALIGIMMKQEYIEHPPMLAQLDMLVRMFPDEEALLELKKWGEKVSAHALNAMSLDDPNAFMKIHAMLLNGEKVVLDS